MGMTKPIETQSDKFKRIARELGPDASEADFDRALRNIAIGSPDHKHKGEKPKAKKPKAAR